MGIDFSVMYHPFLIYAFLDLFCIIYKSISEKFEIYLITSVQHHSYKHFKQFNTVALTFSSLVFSSDAKRFNMGSLPANA